MHCSSCGFAVTANFQFCPQCGTKLSQNCPQCGHGCPLSFRFCPQCGTPLAQTHPPAAPSSVGISRSVVSQLNSSLSVSAIPAGMEAELRPVTVLFADVVGFTSLAERLDPEELRSLMMQCFQALAEEIRRYDGFIEKFIGDAILAVFGAPIAHEDDPERAVRAALGMQARLQQLRATTDGSTVGALTMRIGLNTGL